MNAKDIRKAAFAVGLGFTLGKECGKWINHAIDRLIVDVARNLAKDGNETAQDICKRANIKYEEKEEATAKVNIGFHA